MGFPGNFEALLLIALGMGYLVLYLAKREDKGLQFLGYIVGVIIITLSLIYLVGNTLIQTVYYPRVQHYYKGMMKQHMMPRPMMPQAPAQKP